MLTFKCLHSCNPGGGRACILGPTGRPSCASPSASDCGSLADLSLSQHMHEEGAEDTDCSSRMRMEPAAGKHVWVCVFQLHAHMCTFTYGQLPEYGGSVCRCPSLQVNDKRTPGIAVLAGRGLVYRWCMNEPWHWAEAPPIDLLCMQGESNSACMHPSSPNAALIVPSSSHLALLPTYCYSCCCCRDSQLSFMHAKMQTAWMA